MIHPSYVELMQVVNNDSTVIGEEPVVNSRYSIVIAASKRARQIIGGDEPMIAGASGRKPLSVAVQELYEGKVKIVSEDDESDKKEWQKIKHEDHDSRIEEQDVEQSEEQCEKSDEDSEELNDGLNEKQSGEIIGESAEEHYETE